jgi:hypothetical protein
MIWGFTTDSKTLYMTNTVQDGIFLLIELEISGL